ncbi:hypothetical protein DAEQUDRAFT_242677 [Daedalea quercina L-15889]|uniref:Uncharacterized protein n=1 Tax=Daedalea quercina L-15889 TaxID=1314783 RepID=A0A165QRX2_9APHY|nr:hypothetical protein DAEQUDRAFT_242677 [Daedalea quercina L-15889]
MEGGARSALPEPPPPPAPAPWAQAGHTRPVPSPTRHPLPASPQAAVTLSPRPHTASLASLPASLKRLESVCPTQCSIARMRQHRRYRNRLYGVRCTDAAPDRSVRCTRSLGAIGRPPW